MDWGGQVEGKCTLVLTTNSIYTTAVLTVESVLVAARHRAYMRLFCVACIMKYQQRQQLNASWRRSTGRRPSPAIPPLIIAIALQVYY